MSKHAERIMAVEMRQAGATYTEILDKFAQDGRKVSKGSLSNWLKKIELTPEQLARIQEREKSGQAKGMGSIQQIRAAKHAETQPAAGVSGQVPQV